MAECLEQLPYLVLKSIFAYLPDAANFVSASKKLYQVAKDPKLRLDWLIKYSVLKAWSLKTLENYIDDVSKYDVWKPKQLFEVQICRYSKLMDDCVCEFAFRYDLPFDVFLLALSRSHLSIAATRSFLKRLERSFNSTPRNKNVETEELLMYILAFQFFYCFKTNKRNILHLFLTSDIACQVLHSFYYYSLNPSCQRNGSLLPNRKRVLQIASITFAAQIGSSNINRDDIIYTITMEFPELWRFFDSDGYSPLHIAVKHNNVAFIRTVSKIPKIDFFIHDTKNRQTCFHLACKENRVEIVKILLPIMGPDAGMISTHPIFYCIENPVLMNLLLSHNPPPNPPINKRNQTPLHYAAQFVNASRSIELLLDAGYNTFSRDNFGNLPIHYACFVGNVVSVALLALTNPATINMNDEGRYSFKFILDPEDDVESSQKSMRRPPMTPFEIAFARKFWDVCEFLLKCGAEIEQDKLSTFLYDSAKNGNIKLCLALLEFGADPNEICGGRDSAIQNACRNSRLKIVKILLAFGANPTTCKKELYSAAVSRNYELVKLLLDGLSKQEALEIRTNSAAQFVDAVFRPKPLFPIEKITESQFPIYSVGDIVNGFGSDQLAPILHCVRTKYPDSEAWKTLISIRQCQDIMNDEPPTYAEASPTLTSNKNEAKAKRKPTLRLFS